LNIALSTKGRNIMSNILKIIGLLVIMFLLAGCEVVIGGLAGTATSQHQKFSEPLCPDAFQCMADELAPKGDGYEGDNRTRCRWITEEKHEMVKRENLDVSNLPYPIYNFKLHVKQYRKGDQLCLGYEGKGNNWKDIGGKICRPID
jgi:hypothetical protein